VPGKEERAGAHRNDVPTVRRCKRRRATVFNGGGVAPVVVDEGGWVLQFEGDPGVRRRRSIEGRNNSEGRSPEGRRTAVTLGRSPARRKGSGGGKPVRWTPGRWGRACGTRAWTDEMNGARGRNFSADGRRLGFKGSGGEQAEGWALLGGRAGEKGPGTAWSSAAVWHRRGSGPAAARCRATVESGGVGATRADVADRWVGARRGPSHQRLGAARGSVMRRSERR
jgi:hypothetical protein